METQPAQKPSTSSTSTSATAPSCSSRRSDGAASSANSSPTCKKKKSKRIENKKANAPPSIHPYNDHLQYPERAGGRDAKGTTSSLRDGERGLAPITCISRKRCGCQSLSQFCGKREARKASGGGIIGPWCQQGGLPCLVDWERERGNNGSHGSPGVRCRGHVCVCGRFLLFWGVLFLVWLRLNGACSTDGGSGLNDDAPLLSLVLQSLGFDEY